MCLAVVCVEGCISQIRSQLCIKFMSNEKSLTLEIIRSLKFLSDTSSDENILSLTCPTVNFSQTVVPLIISGISTDVVTDTGISPFLIYFTSYICDLILEN